ncbi:MAG: protein-glutamate O-methyltransferase CheR [Desulfovibrio sp.]|nr:protein-glutamate O-methyltransferase CheR [Desulfovibrio sp.]MBI4959286.1 protein-glutamate O-methyltransferase CheR [Desulfovibrio sp.]
MTLFSSSPLLLRKTTPISDEEFRQLRDFIYSKCGIWVDEKRKYLFENRFQPRIAELGLKTFGEYIKLLSYGRDSVKELERVYELVTTNETSLFRDTKQLDGFTANVLTPLINDLRQKNKFELNIWSAGCSSGEEPYTLAIIIHELLGLELKRWRVNITGVDLSPPMIAKAKEGVFGDYSFKTTPDAIKAKHFTKCATGYKISPAVASLVNFQVMNLNDSLALKRLPKSHIVFCRNVIIYFDVNMKKKALAAFYDNLLPGGTLMLGHSESLHSITNVFRPKMLSNCIAYLKV